MTGFKICTDPCKQAVREQNSSAQKFVRTRVNGALVVQYSGELNLDTVNEIL